MVSFAKSLTGEASGVRLPQASGTISVGGPARKPASLVTTNRGQHRAEQSRYQARCRAAMLF